MIEKDFPIHFIITGGTIDSHYDGTKDTARPNKKSKIPDFIKSLKLYRKCKFNQICMKDSREVTQKDQKKIIDTVEKSPFKKIIITHGTYTMPDTGRYLKVNLKRKDQTIILTGSMIPMYGFTNSDGPFNLGYSIASFKDLKSGIYVCMNGKIFTPEEVLKIMYEGKFGSIFGEK